MTDSSFSLKKRKVSRSSAKHRALAAIGFLSLLSLNACEAKFYRETFSSSAATSQETIQVVVASTVNGCGNFTVTATALTPAGITDTSVSGPATWSDSFSALTPGTPTDFVNGVSTTTVANVSLTGDNDTITVNYGAYTGSSNSFNVNNVVNFAGLGFANVHLDGSFGLFWSPAYDNCGSFAGITNYNLFDSTVSGGENYASASYSVAGSSFQTQSVGTGHSDTLFFVGRALAGSSADTNTTEMSMRTDPLALGTLTGGRYLHNADPLSGSVRAESVDLDSYGNLFFINGPSVTQENTVAVLCATTSGYCTGKTIGQVYIVSGSGAYSLLANADYSHAHRFSYATPTTVKLDSNNNVHVQDGTEELVTCVNEKGLCASTTGAPAIDYSGVSSSGVAAKVYKGGLLADADYETFDSNGNIYFGSVSQHAIYVRCVSITGICAHTSTPNIVTSGGIPGTLGGTYVLAGTGSAGDTGNGGSALSAEINTPKGIAVDSFGNVVFADSTANVIKVVCESVLGMCSRVSGTKIVAAAGAATVGDIYYVAGTGGGYADGGSATVTNFSAPEGLRLDSAGNVVLADVGDNTIRVVCNSTTGLCSHVSGSAIATAGGVATVADIYLLAGTQASSATTCGGTTGVPCGDGSSATSAILAATDLAIDSNNNVIFTSKTDGTASTQSIRTSVTRVVCMSASGVCAHASGADIDFSSGSSVVVGSVYLLMGDYLNATGPDGVDSVNGAVRQPAHVSEDSAGNFVISAMGGNKIQVVCASQSGLCAHVSGSNITTSGGAGTVNNIYTLAGNGWAVNSGDGAVATSAAIYQPAATAVDSAGNVIIAENAEHIIRVVCMNPGAGVCQKVDGSNHLIFSGGSVPTLGSIYILAGTGTWGYTGDNTAAYLAELNQPYGVVVDSHNNVIIADSNNGVVRIVCVTALGPYCSSVNGTVVTTSSGGAATIGNIYTLAGTGTHSYSGDGALASSATLITPRSVGIDNHDNVAVVDLANFRVRIVCGSSLGLCASVTGGNVAAAGSAATALSIYTVAGTGSSGSSGDDAASYLAQVSAQGASFDSNGNLIIADTGSLKVRIVCNTNSSGFCLHATGSVIDATGSAATNFNIYTLAGGGSAGYGGDGLISSNTNVKLDSPTHAMVDSSGRLIISDQAANRIRFAFP